MAIVLDLSISFDEALKRARSDLHCCWELYCSYERASLAKMKSLAGPLLSRMMFSPRITKSYVEKPAGSLSIVALLLVLDYWDPGDYFVPACLRVAFQHPESHIRGLALMALFRLRGWIEDPTGFLPKLESSFGHKCSLIQEIKHNTLSEEFSALQVTFERLQQTELRRLAGVHFEEMTRGLSMCEQYLLHQNSELRRAALWIIGDKWRLSQRIAGVCEVLALNDPDPIVRRVALAALGRYYAKTDDKRIGGILARIVSDESMDLECRQFAYYGLFEVRGMPAATHPIAVSAPRRFRFAEDVDWAFVHTFVANKDGEE